MKSLFRAIILIFVSASPGQCLDYNPWADYLRVPKDYSTIQAGIDAAVDGDVVLVANGTYTGYGNKNLDFKGKAITVMSENGPDWTIIDCEYDGRGFYFQSGEDSLSRLEGFTIQNGYDDKGGGIYCENSSPTITNCTITGNKADYYDGGGIYCVSSSPIITNCTITGNEAKYSYGGGFYLDGSSPTITNCTITGNTAGDNGGGIYYYNNSSPTITNCILWNDTPQEVYISEADPIITYSDVEGGWEGKGNINSDPLFEDPESGDYSLLPSSPCIDAGDPYSRFDLDGTVNDMGSNGGMGDFPKGVIGGTISGTLSISGSPYIVSENLVVEMDDTLIVESGVELLLHNRSGILVMGDLLAEGAADDSITITKFQEWDRGGGVRFLEGDGTLSFCLISLCQI